jgi:hypothetical protein
VVVHALHQMSANSGGEAGATFRSAALLPKDEAAQRVPQVLDLLRVTGGTEPFGQIEKFPFLPSAGLDALLDQFHQNTVIAETPLLRYRPHLPGNVGRQRHASTHVSSRGSFGYCHCIIVHHIDAQLPVHSSYKLGYIKGTIPVTYDAFRPNDACRHRSS